MVGQKEEWLSIPGLKLNEGKEGSIQLHLPRLLGQELRAMQAHLFPGFCDLLCPLFLGYPLIYETKGDDHFLLKLL